MTSDFPNNAFEAAEFLGAAATRRSVEKLFLEILQNSQENTCATISFLI